MTMDSAIRIKAVGDICPGDKAVMGLGVLDKTKKYGVGFPLELAKDNLIQSDLVLGNFEGLLTARTRKKNANLTFCGLPEIGEALLDAGFGVLNVANNHAFEHGPEIFNETVNILKNAGLKVCGLRSNSGSFYSEPVIITVRSKKIGILGYNWVMVDKFKDADQYIAQSHDSIVNYTWDRDNRKEKDVSTANIKVIQDIKKLRQEVDIVILVAHWAYEFVTIPPYGVTLEAHSFIDAGADLIIGHHPHVLHGMERYKNGLIFYSLGNFIFDFRNDLPKHTCILDVMIQQDKNMTYEFHPFYINKRFQPEPASSAQERTITTLLDQSNSSIAAPDKETLLCDNTIYKRYEDCYRIGKISTIYHHFRALGEDPAVILVIIKKGENFMRLLINRLKGKRDRW